MAVIPTVELYKKGGGRVVVNRDEMDAWLDDGWTRKPLRAVPAPERGGQSDKSEAPAGKLGKDG